MLTKEKQKAIIEAMLFVSTQPLSVGKIVRKLKKAARLEEKRDLETGERDCGTVRLCDEETGGLGDEVTVGFDDGANDERPTTNDESDVIEIDELKVEGDAENDNVVLTEDVDVDEEDEDDEDDDEEVDQDDPPSSTDADYGETSSADIMKQLMEKQEELDQEISHADVKALLKEIQEDLQKVDRGVELVTVAKGYQFRTKYDISLYLKDEKAQTPSRFSPSALETLAIVAYQQPITRIKLEEVRGVDSGGVMKTLLDKGILRVVGRSDDAGKALVYGTSKKFLEIFSLQGLRDLPSLQDYHSLQLSQDQEQIEVATSQTDEIQIDDLVEDDYSDLSESEQAVLEDLNQSMKDLKHVEKEILATQKEASGPASTEVTAGEQGSVVSDQNAQTNDKTDLTPDH